MEHGAKERQDTLPQQLLPTFACVLVFAHGHESMHVCFMYCCIYVCMYCSVCIPVAISAPAAAAPIAVSFAMLCAPFVAIISTNLNLSEIINNSFSD